jgi:hypothetical protein
VRPKSDYAVKLSIQRQIIIAQLRAALARISMAGLRRRAALHRRRRWFTTLERQPALDVPASELGGCVPIRVDLEADAVDWLPGRSLRPRRGFFYETLTASLAAVPPPTGTRSTVASLARLGSSPADAPTGFVFHVSRCGSTLLGNMLLGSPRHLVVQEAESFNAVLRARDRSDAERITLLRAIAAAFATARRPDQQHLFVKFSSWNVLELPLLRRAFPRVPWLFVYRDPVEVIASNLIEPGTWVREQRDPGRGPYLAGVAPAQALAMTREEYCARVIDRYFRAALAHADELAHFVHYEQISEACLRYVLGAFGVSASESELAAMTEQTSFYSKGADRDQRHRGDGVAKQRIAGPALRAGIEGWTRESYRAVDQRRAPF